MFYKGLIYLGLKFKTINHNTNPTKQLDKAMLLQQHINR